MDYWDAVDQEYERGMDAARLSGIGAARDAKQEPRASWFVRLLRWLRLDGSPALRQP